MKNDEWIDVLLLAVALLIFASIFSVIPFIALWLK